MIQRLALVFITLVGLIVALPRVPIFAGEIVAQGGSTPTPTPPMVIPAWVLGGGHFYPGIDDVDPGATPDQLLFAGVLDASATTNTALETNCPGIGSGPSNVSNCNPYKYVSMLVLLCDGTLDSSDAYSHLDGAHEAGFLHAFTSPPYTPTPSPSNRIPVSGGECAPMPNPSTGFPTNPDDSNFQNWLVNNVWTTTSTNFPVPYGIYEDHFAVVGGYCYPSYEYGNEACDLRGTSASPAPHNWETALGDFESNAETNCPTTCFAFVGNGLTPGGGKDTGACDNVVTGHCHASPDAGIVDDMDAIDKLCSAADSNGHLQGITAEEIAFLKGTPAPGPTPTNTPVYADTQTMVYMVNTMSHLVNYTSGGCANTVAIDVESSGGSFPGLPNYPPGSVSAGIPIREEATALRFLVPDPRTLVPDRMEPFYFTVGGTANNVANCNASPYCEVPYFFEETLVPQGPEVPVAPFAWNGMTPSVGDGCPSPAPSDTGGAVNLMVACLTDPDTTDGAAVLRQEYQHLYVNGHDHGPAAVLLNTASSASATILSSWFTCSGCTPLSSFHYVLRLSGGELQSVLYDDRLMPIAMPCTATTYCNGDSTLSGNTTTFGAGFTIGAHSGVILLGSN